MTEYIKIILLAGILIMLFTLGVLINNMSFRAKFPNVATKADYQVTVQPGGHLHLYDGGLYDIKTMPKSIIHKNGK